MDWSDVEAAELLFDGMHDYNTGEPITITPNTIVVPTALKHTASRVLNATEIEFGSPGSTSDVTVTHAANPLTGAQYTIITGPMVKDAGENREALGEALRTLGTTLATQMPGDKFLKLAQRIVCNDHVRTSKGQQVVFEQEFRSDIRNIIQKVKDLERQRRMDGRTDMWDNHLGSPGGRGGGGASGRGRR